jgi:hypothetical protein
MIRKLVKTLVLVPLAIVFIALAVANPTLFFGCPLTPPIRSISTAVGVNTPGVGSPDPAPVGRARLMGDRPGGR